jgi:hypothetical protein
MRFGVSIAVSIKVGVVWDVTPCYCGRTYQRFEGICYLHLQGRHKVFNVNLIGYLEKGNKSRYMRFEVLAAAWNVMPYGLEN